MKKFKWKSLILHGEIPSPREGMAYTSISDPKKGSNIAIFGGCNEEKQECFNDLYMVDATVKEPKFTKVRPSQQSRFIVYQFVETIPKVEGSSLVLISQSLILFGGCSFNVNCSNSLFSLVEVSQNQFAEAEVH